MKNNYNAVYDNNGKLVDINVSLPQGFPADLSEISGFDISKKFVVAKNWYDYPHLTNEFRKCEIKKIN